MNKIFKKVKGNIFLWLAAGVALLLVAVGAAFASHTRTVSAAECTEHSYTNGICTACGGYEEATLNGEYYEIGNAGKLYWFAVKVNGGSVSINGKLTADIVIPTGKEWTPIGYSNNRYNGTFDGDGKTVSGVVCSDTSKSYVGLFGAATSGAIIKNVGVINSDIKGKNYVGAIVGSNGSGNITNCYNTGNVTGNSMNIGGIAGMNSNGTISYCYNTGAVSASSYVGGIAGMNSNGTISYCYNTGTVKGNSWTCYNICGSQYYSTVENSYFLYNTERDDEDNLREESAGGGTVKKAEAFYSGEVAYLLNESKTDSTQAYYQDLSATDSLPNFNSAGGTVYYGYKDCALTYANETLNAEPTHKWSEATCQAAATCSVCGETGEKNAENHTGEDKWEATEYKHKKAWTCCGLVTKEEADHTFVSGVCSVCEYKCEHGKYIPATCNQQAVCEICGSSFGEVDSDKHTGALEYSTTETTHQQYYTCCNATVGTAEEHTYEKGSSCDTCGYKCNHTGGTAYCNKQAECTVCKHGYGDLDPKTHSGEAKWYPTAEKHEQIYECCEAVKVALENHEWEKGVCKECGYTCEHTGGTATCENAAVCTYCGESYGTALGHSYGEATYTWTATDDGWSCTAERVCANDKSHNETETVAGVYSVVTEATCGAIGVGKYTATFEKTAFETQTKKVYMQATGNHTGGTEWKSDDTQHWHECTVCHAECDFAEHVLTTTEAKAATCTEKGYEAYDTCSTCGFTTYTETDALGHNYGEWVETTKATCTTAGVKTKTCTRCGEKETEAVAALGHDTVSHEAKAATCTEGGWNAYETCSRCDYTTKVETAALGHNYGTEWKSDGTQHWHECTVCHAAGEKQEHAYTDDKDAECNTCGYTRTIDTDPITPDPTDPVEEPAEEKKGLSGGAIAGIVIGSVAVVGVGGFAIFWFVIKKKTFADIIAIFKK